MGGFPYLLYVTAQLYRRLVGYSVSLDPQIPLCCPCGSFQLFCRGWCLACYGRRSRSRARFGGLREKILARDHHGCRVCGAREGLVVHHRRRIGVEITPHDLRRTFAKLAHQGRVPLEQIQLSLGHASIQTTERYLGVRQDLHDAPCDRLGLDILAP